MNPLFGLLGDLGRTIFGSIFPDPKDALKRQEAELAFQRVILENQAALEKAAAENIRTEAASTHWLAANWRPLIMLTFGMLVVADWFGFTPPNMPNEIKAEVYGMMKMGLGGYMGLRTVEKSIPSVLEILKKK